MRRHTWSGAALLAALSLVAVGCSSDSSAPVESTHEPTHTGSTQIALTRKADTMNVDQSIQLNAIVPPAPGTIAPQINWTSSDNSVAFVTKTGVLFGLKTGRATITATASGYSDATVVTVNPGIRDIDFDSDSLSISLAQSVKIPYRVTDTDGNPVDLSQHKVEWSSTDPAVAGMTSDATVTGRAIGRADVLLRVDNKVGEDRRTRAVQACRQRVRLPVQPRAGRGADGAARGHHVRRERRRRSRVATSPGAARTPTSRRSARAAS